MRGGGQGVGVIHDHVRGHIHLDLEAGVLHLVHIQGAEVGVIQEDVVIPITINILLVSHKDEMRREEK